MSGAGCDGDGPAPRQEAVARYGLAAALSPRDAKVYHNRAASLERLGRPAEAAADRAVVRRLQAALATVLQANFRGRRARVAMGGKVISIPPCLFRKDNH